MLVGLAAGLLAFGVGRVLGEPQVNKAIAFEEYVEYNVHHEAPEDGPVSRAVQDSGGLGAGTILYGVAFGGLFALVFAAAYGRLGTMTARGTAAVLGLLGFVSVYLVPVLKYPANPPAIGNPDTIGRRTTLFLVMILLSIAAIVIAVVVRWRLVYRFGEWNATLIVGGGYLAAMALCFVLLPGINEVPQQVIAGVVPAVTDADTTFPPVVLWRFRIASLAIQIVIWATIAIGFGALAHRLFAYEHQPEVLARS
jgi:Probable cobalt transporter subunit (CbtA)